jgi:hypothetical protein
VLKRRPGKARLPGELTVVGLLDVELAFMRNEAEPPDAPYGAWWDLHSKILGKDAVFCPDRPLLRDMWRVAGPAITQEWAESTPGRRPRCWWVFADEPRRRVGGSGTPEFNWGRGWPQFVCGVPACWRWKAAGGDADPDDPPTFEAEASYLLRRNMLTDGERCRLTDVDFEPISIEPRR